MSRQKPVVGIVVGSMSDRTMMDAAADMLQRFGVSHEVRTLPRQPDAIHRYARTAASRGLQVLIAGSPGHARLAEELAAQTTLPVISVPIATGGANTLSHLLGKVQPRHSIPIAMVAINNAANGALLAIQCLALADRRLQQALVDHKRQLAASTHQADRALPRSFDSGSTRGAP